MLAVDLGSRGEQQIDGRARPAGEIALQIDVPIVNHHVLVGGHDVDVSRLQRRLRGDDFDRQRRGAL